MHVKYSHTLATKRNMHCCQVLYFMHLPRSPLWADLHQIWFRGSHRRRNHLWQIFGDRL